MLQSWSPFWSPSRVNSGSSTFFTLYTTPLSSITSAHAVSDHLHADDSQLYVSFALGNSATALTDLQSCLTSVQSWMSRNKLKLNPDKTEFLLIGNKRQWSKYFSMFPIEIFDVETNPSKSALNLEVILGKTFAFGSCIFVVCVSCFHVIQDLWHIRCYLHLDNAKLLANALVCSCLDYCNLLLSSIADIDITKLQHVQNRPAHAVTSHLHLLHCCIPFIGYP